jgi:hypothetical protein
MKPLESKKIKDFTVEIHSDSDCENPLEMCEEIATVYQYGRKNYRTPIFTGHSERSHLLHLANKIHPDFPDDEKLDAHLEAIVEKYFVRSQITTQDYTFLEIVTNVSDWAKEGSKLSAQEYADSLAKAYSIWLNGECVGFITKDKDGNEIDSCWGFYSSEDAYQAAQENFPTRDDQYYFDLYENQ